ncbi:unnamed protein product [Ilex paraguariensis]|uniref:Uncharacterized protein n=1 Tax=Ilex paraguariensis TaxID=185542 RepID=A0ABC8SBV1_9AQUA
MIMPTQKHRNTAPEDVEPGFLLLHHRQTPLPQAGFPANFPAITQGGDEVRNGHGGRKVLVGMDMEVEAEIEVEATNCLLYRPGLRRYVSTSHFSFGSKEMPRPVFVFVFVFVDHIWANVGPSYQGSIHHTLLVAISVVTKYQHFENLRADILKVEEWPTFSENKEARN